MTERGPRRDYGPVAGNEDNSNNAESSIGSESSIDYHDDDNDDHKETGEGNEIESGREEEEREGRGEEESPAYQNQIQNAFDVLNRQESVKDQNDSSAKVVLRDWYDSDPTLPSPKMINADNPAINHLDSEAQARRVVCLKKEDNIPGQSFSTDFVSANEKIRNDNAEIATKEATHLRHDTEQIEPPTSKQKKKKKKKEGGPRLPVEAVARQYAFIANAANVPLIAANRVHSKAVDLPTLAILKNEMSKLSDPKKKPKEGGWAHSIASKNIDNWQIITRSEEIDDLSVHQLMIFLQAHSCIQLDLHKSFLQKCNLNQFFEDIAPEKIQSDFNTIQNCLKLIQDAASDTTKIAKQIAILEGVSIVQSMIKVKKERAKSQWEVDSILTTAAAPIQELMKKPPVVAARKFVEVDLLMTCSIGDTQSKSLEDIKSLCVASYPVPGKNYKQVYHNLGWMKMDCNKTMWILPNAAVCAEQFNALPKGSTQNYLACTLFVEMLPMVLDSHFAKKTGGYPFMFQFLCKAFDMNVGAGYWKVINESLPNLKRNCTQLFGKHLLSSPFFPYQAGDKVLRNKHPETSFYTVKEDDCNIEMIHRQCLHVAHTLDLPYHRPMDIELLGIAQAVGMVPAADNSFKYQTSLKGGKTAAAMKVGIYDPKHRGKGGRARNVLMGHQQWNDNQIKVLLEYVIANFGSGRKGGINWSKWETDGVEGCNKEAGKSKLQKLKIQYNKRMNEGDDRKTNDANIKQFYQNLLAEQLSLES